MDGVCVCACRGGGGVTVTLRLDQGDEWWRSLKIPSNNILK